MFGGLYMSIDVISEMGYKHWHSSHYAVTHMHNKIVTFKGGHLMW